MKTTTLPKSKATATVQHALEARLKALKREEVQVEAMLASYRGNSGIGKSQENKERFRSHDLLPVLQKMKKDFTLEDLLAAAHKKGLQLDKTQLYSALNAFRSMVHIVVPGMGRRIAVYRYVGGE